MLKVGDTVEGKMGNTITILSSVGKRVVVSCSVCSLDEEMYPLGSLNVDKWGLDKNKSISCGCSKQPRYKEWQYIIKVRRLCNTLDYTFLGWVGEYVDSRGTKIRLKDNVVGNTWDSTNIRYFLQGSLNPTLTGTRLSTMFAKSKVEWVADLTSKHPAGVTFNNFQGVEGRNSYTTCDYNCPVCRSQGEGVFNSLLSNLMAGKCPCLCNKGKWGKYRNKLSDIDQLYLICFESERESFFKVGRSFHLSSRIKDFIRVSSCEVTLIATVVSNHERIFSLEQKLHQALKRYHLKPLVPFSGSATECFNLSGLKDELLSKSFTSGFIQTKTW